MMDEEIVKKRKWIDRDKFLDFYGATNLLPGPNSTELAIHLGFERGGVLGLIIAGLCFILPAMIIVTALAAIYNLYGTMPQIEGIMYGIKPVIIAVILQALLRLGKTALKNKSSVILAIVVIVLAYFGIHEIALLFISGLIMMLIVNRDKLRGKNYSLSFFLPTIPLSVDTVNEQLANNITTNTLFLTFLKIGSVLYGSGYVLLAFLETYFVDRFGVITTQQLLDAVSIGQFTPGPVFTTATFIGYIVNGIPGAIVSTIGIFLPAFLMVGLLNNVIPKLRNSQWVSGILDGVNVASLALMAVVSLKLGISAIHDFPTIILAALSIVLVFKYNVNSAWLVLSGGFIGLILSVI